jgi:hypothetical protein
MENNKIIVNSGLSDNINIQNAFDALTNNNHSVENSLYWINEYLYQRRFELGDVSGAPDSTLTGNLVEESNGVSFEFFNGIKDCKDCKDDKIIKIKKLLEISQANIDEAFIILDNIVSTSRKEM